jgi:voltage-gated potassium channel
MGLIHAAFHEPQTRTHSIVQTIVWGMIILSVVTLAIEFMTDGEAPRPGWLANLDRAILTLFAIELVLRVGSFRPPELTLFDRSFIGRLRTHVLGRLHFCLRPLIIIDIVTVAALVPALRGLRILRLLRLIRTAELFRYSRPFGGLGRAFRENSLLFAFALAVLGATVVLGGSTLTLVERDVNPAVDSIGDGVWWALVTVTTVGFGDIIPVTTLGRMIGGVLMVGGLFNLALFAGIVGNTLVGVVLRIRREQFRVSDYSGHVVICGYDTGARVLLDSLRQEFDPSQIALVVFSEGIRPEDLPPDFAWVNGDPTKESELDKARLTHARAALLVARRGVLPQQADAVTILTAFTIRSYLAARQNSHPRRKPVYIAAEILDSENVGHAMSAGADEVIETTRLGFSLLSHAVSMPGTASIMSQVATIGAHSIFVASLPADIPVPASFGDVVRRIKQSSGALVIGLRNPETGDHVVNPADTTEIGRDSQVIYLAEGPVLQEA